MFAALEWEGFISSEKPVYAVDIDPARLLRVARRFPYVTTVVSPADSMRAIPDASLDFVVSTMLLEHVPDDKAVLDEIWRVLKPGGRAWITTVFKRKWAWYFRRRSDETVLDVSHVREYTDVNEFRALLGEGRRSWRVLDLELEPLWFPIFDPVLFRIADSRIFTRLGWFVRLLRCIRLPVPGYYTLAAVVER